MNDPVQKSINAEWFERMRHDTELRKEAFRLFRRLSEYRYSYNFTWLGRPIIQFPEDIVAMQEIIWRIRPDLIIETGIAHGGSLMLWASMLHLIGDGGRVLGIDIDIRAHNRVEIERHPLAAFITMIQGSSIDPQVVASARSLASRANRVMVILDSNHTHEHVLAELQQYAPLVGGGSYLVVLDTVVEDMPDGSFPDRPWGKGNNPKTAVREFLGTTDRFEVDRDIEDKLVLSVAPNGYLRCLRDPA